MIRPLATELLLFLAPFALYAAFLFATRAGVFDPDAWSTRALLWLGLAAIVCAAIGLAVLMQFSRAPAHSKYVPAHIENGKLVPGRVE
jgi:hypothetical protein